MQTRKGSKFLSNVNIVIYRRMISRKKLTGLFYNQQTLFKTRNLKIINALISLFLSNFC